MRTKFVAFALVPLLILGILLYFFLDGWIEAGLESAGESLTGAKVEIDHLRFSLFPLRIRIARLQVADADDPWKNLFETGPVAFSMDINQLLRGKYIIETMEVNELIPGTRRTTDGSLPGKARRPASATQGPLFADLVQQILEKTVEKTPLFDPAMLRGSINIDSLVRAQRFHTLLLIDSLRQSALTATQRWDSLVADFESGKRKLQGIEASIRAINPSALRTADQILAAIATVDSSYRTINDMTTVFDARQKSVRGYFTSLSGAVATIPQAAEEDYRKILSLARLPDFNALGLAELMLGKQMLTDIRRYARWADIARAQMARASAQPEIETPPRMKGQNIRFPIERGYPKFWIKQITVSGSTDPRQDPAYVHARGEVRNVSSDQRIAGVPLSVALEGSRGSEISFSLRGLVDRTKDIPLDVYRVTAAGVPLATFEIGKSDFLPSRISEARLTSDVVVRIPGDAFEARAELKFRKMKTEFMREPANIGERLAREVLGGVSGFDAELRLWNRGDGLDVAFQSDLDDQFAALAKGALGAELARLQLQVWAKVDAVLVRQRQEFERTFEAKKADVLGRLSGYEKYLAGVSDLAEGKKKELLLQMEKQGKGKLDDVFKKLFKK